jgi:hypothetical protein
VSIQRTAQEAVRAVNKVATLTAADRAQRLIAMLQIQRHVDGLVRKLKDEDQPLNPVSQRTGD